MKHLEQKFKEVFGKDAEQQFFAPGRINAAVIAIALIPSK